MNVRNCTRCGRIFNYVTGQPICSQCKGELENLFKEVRTYIRRNPKASLQQVSDECGVDTKQLRQWIREERLSFTADSGVGIECEKCGKTIRTGRFCEECKSDTLNDFKSVGPSNSAPVDSPSQKKERKSQMHFLNRDK